MTIQNLKLESMELAGVTTFDYPVIEAILLNHADDPSSGNFDQRTQKVLLMSQAPTGEIVETILSKDSNNNVLESQAFKFEFTPEQSPVELLEFDYPQIQLVASQNNKWFKAQNPDYVETYFLTHNQRFPIFNNSLGQVPEILMDIELGENHPIWINLCLSESSNLMCVNIFSGLTGRCLLSHTYYNELVSLIVPHLFLFNWWVWSKKQLLVATFVLIIALLVLCVMAAATAGPAGGAVTLGVYLTTVNPFACVALVGLVLAFLSRLIALLREIYAVTPAGPAKAQLNAQMVIIQNHEKKLQQLSNQLEQLKDNAQQQAQFIQKAKEALNEIDATMTDAVAAVDSGNAAAETIQDPDLKDKVKGALGKIKSEIKEAQEKSKGLTDH